MREGILLPGPAMIFLPRFSFVFFCFFFLPTILLEALEGTNGDITERGDTRTRLHAVSHPRPESKMGKYDDVWVVDFFLGE